MNDEAHFSAEPLGSRTPPWLSRPFGNAGRPQGAGSPPCTRPQDSFRLIEPTAGPALRVIGRRADFLAANGGKRAPMPGFVLLVRNRSDGDPAMRLGITVTKKIGNAVVRNRMKRRFRALAREILPAIGLPGSDHILIGRATGIERSFDDLRRDLGKALGKIQG